MKLNMLALISIIFFSVVIAHNGNKIVVKKCCNFDEIYHHGNDSCVLLDSSDNTTDWNELLPKNQLIGRIDEAGSEFAKCGPGFEYRQMVFDPSEKSKLAVVLGGRSNGARIIDHPEKPWVDLENICYDGVQDGDGKHVLARMCFKPPCSEKICVRKCCPRKFACYQTEYAISCGQSSDPIKVERYHVYTFSAEKVNETLERESHTLIGIPPDCPKNSTTILDPAKDENNAFYVDVDGSLYVPKYRESFPVHQYCVDKMDDSQVPVAILCFIQTNKDPSEMSNEELAVYASLAILSQVCLLITFVVYALLPNLRNLFGKNLMSYVTSLFLGYFCLACIQLRGVTIMEASKGLCKALGLLVHYLFMVAFFWLSVMSFDLWRTFRSMKSQSGRESVRADKKRFLLYCIYAWGSPLLVSSVTVVMEFASGISPFYIKPNFAHNGCWFSTKTRTFAYFIGPMALILLVNVAFFVMTTMKILKIVRDTKAIKDMQDNKQQKQNKNSFVLYIKLLVVMGVSWLLELIWWAAGGPTYIWYLANVCNALHGVFIFLIFVCKKKIILMLNNKYKLIQNKRVLEILRLESTTTQVSQGSNGTNITNASRISPV